MHKPSLNAGTDGQAARGPTANEKQPEPVKPMSLDERPPDHTSGAHSYINSTTSLYPVPLPRRSTARRAASLVPTSGVSVYPTVRESYEEEDDDGQAVREAYAVEFRHRLSSRARMERGTGSGRSSERLIQTAYFTHTDAGHVRLVELPPSYNGLQVQPTDQEDSS